MKKLATFVFAMLLAGSLSFAQDTGGAKTATKTSDAPKTTSGKKAKTSKAHKGGKKSKKGSTSTATPPPK